MSGAAGSAGGVGAGGREGGGGGRWGWRPKSLRTSGLRSSTQVEATYRIDMTWVRFDEIYHIEPVLVRLIFDYRLSMICIEVIQTFPSIVDASFVNAVRYVTIPFNVSQVPALLCDYMVTVSRLCRAYMANLL